MQTALDTMSKSYQNCWMANLGENNVERLLTLAASSASVEEQANSALKDGKFPDGSKPVMVEKRIWRAQVKSQYIEPEVDIDPSEKLDYLFIHAGKTVLKHSVPLPPRDDIINFSNDEHQHIFMKFISMEGLSDGTSNGD